jgi:UDP-glucose 4-epimerase
MKFVVTGAIGHIGSKLVRELPRLSPGCDVLMVDNMATQRFPSLFDLPGGANYQFVEADVTAADLSPLIKGADVVVQLAAITDAAASFDNAEEVERVNFIATSRIAEACAESGVRLIHPSSTSVYGTQNEKVDEDCTLDDLKPQSPYAETKLREEALLAEMANEHGLKHITCRFGTIFGTSPGMRFHTAVNKFCWQAVMGQPLTVWRTAMDQKRPYLALEDAIAAIGLIIQRDLFDGRIYNVLTANATVRDIVDTIRRFVPELEVSLVDSKIMNQLSYEVGFERISKHGFQPSGALAQGIGDTVKLLQRANSRA